MLVLGGGAIRAKPPVYVEKNGVSWSGPLGGWLGRAGNTAAKGLLGCRNCGQSYVWLPPSTCQMGHQFIGSGRPYITSGTGLLPTLNCILLPLRARHLLSCIPHHRTAMMRT